MTDDDKNPIGPDPDSPATQARALRLLLATIDGDEQRADQVLDEEPSDLSPRLRAAFKQNALELVTSMEAQHGRDAARDMLEAALLRIQEEEWEHSDTVGYVWHQLRCADAEEELG